MVKTWWDTHCDEVLTRAEKKNKCHSSFKTWISSSSLIGWQLWLVTGTFESVRCVTVVSCVMKTLCVVTFFTTRPGSWASSCRWAAVFPRAELLNQAFSRGSSCTLWNRDWRTRGNRYWQNSIYITVHVADAFIHSDVPWGNKPRIKLIGRCRASFPHINKPLTSHQRVPLVLSSFLSSLFSFCLLSFYYYYD